MKRNVSLAEISDGRLYKENDMVKADCHGCKNCHLCCTGMGESIVLDPYDAWRLQKGTGKGLQELLGEGKLELHVVDGCILPNLAMNGPDEACSFLNEEGRCSVHGYRPGICRLFPLGRYYENGDFTYFLQTGECAEQNRSKVKVEKWIDTPGLKRNHKFVRDWHYFLNAVEEAVTGREDSEFAKGINMAVLTAFYFLQADTEEAFYALFEERREALIAQYDLKVQ